ncbi:MAG: CoA pyrophosphatase [Pseudomonadales bacterium]|nr:CoA pyrophosphatase [Pseudomonadales bacterium]
MLDQIRTKLSPPNFDNSPQDRREAAVLIPLTDQTTPDLVLTRRAAHMNSHAGEVAFPGGKKDPEDLTIIDTALRESHEEIGLAPRDVEVIGAMRPAKSKFGLMVTPIVGVIHPEQSFIPNEEELDHIFTVPLNYFLDNLPTDIHRATYEGKTFEVPCYNYEGNIIWGLTAYFIADFMNQIFNTDIKIQLRSNQNNK